MEEEFYSVLKNDFDSKTSHFAVYYGLQLIKVKSFINEFDPYIRHGAKELVKFPNRLPDALKNQHRIIDEAESRIKEGGDISKSLKDALSRLCPIFPFC